MITARIIGLVIGYCAGLFQTGLFVSKAEHTDLRRQGSGNTGMTNSIRVLGWKAGAIVLIGDLAKCVAAMVVVWLLFHRTYPDAVQLLELYAGLGAVLGHDFPFYLKFRGGKGIACSIGLICTFDWRMIPICAILFFSSVLPTGYMSLGSLGILAGFFVQTIIFGQAGILWTAAQYLPELYVVSGIITAIGFIRHRANIARLIHGEENKFIHKKK